MNTRTRTILIAGALAASASSLGSQAADQDAYFARQMALGSGSPAPQAVVASRPVLPETARELQWDKDFARQMALGSGSPAPQAVVASRPVLPETARQLQRDQDFGRQVTMGSGGGNLLLDVVPSGADQAVAAAQVTDPQSGDAAE